MEFIKVWQGYELWRGHYGEIRVVCAAYFNKPHKHKLFDSVTKAENWIEKA